MKVFVCIYALSFIFAIVSALGIGISDEVFDLEMVLKSKSDFIRCVFMWQFAVAFLLDYCINPAGIIILEILTTIVVLPENIMVFAVLVACLIIKGICILFYKIFWKKEE